MADDAERSGRAGRAGGAGGTGETGLREEAATEARPAPELRWIQIRDPKRMDELGRNGRVVGSFFHEGYDAWEVLLVTYEGEVSGERRQNR